MFRLAELNQIDVKQRSGSQLGVMLRSRGGDYCVYHHTSQEAAPPTTQRVSAVQDSSQRAHFQYSVFPSCSMMLSTL